jgi:hypothetical protein
MFHEGSHTQYKYYITEFHAKALAVSAAEIIDARILQVTRAEINN